MLRLHLAVATALSISNVASLLLLFGARRTTEYRIQLPVSANEVLHDFFHITKPEDLVDGYPVAADSFWMRMRLRKLFISLLLVSAVAITMTSLGWAIANEDKLSLAFYAIHTTFTTYVLLLSALSVRRNTPPAHKESILHLTVLLGVSFALFGISAIMPQPAAAKVLPSSTPWLLLTLFYGLATTTCLTTPLGPPLYYPPSDIYPKIIAEAITNPEEINVCDVVASSPLDLLLFSYSTKVISMAKILPSINIGDLPILPVDMRAIFNYVRMKDAIQNVSLRSITPNSGFLLIYQLIHLNFLLFVTLIILSLILPFTAYIAPFFLRKLVASLENDPGRNDIGWGWVYVAGLFSGQSFAYLMNGQVFSLAGTIFQTRLKLQLGSVLYAKTLVRKDVAAYSPSFPAAQEANGSTNASAAASKGDDTEFSSKAQVLNLMTTDGDRTAEFAGHAFMIISSCMETIVATVFLYDLLGISSFVGLAVIIAFLPLNRYSGKVVIGVQRNLMKSRDERLSLMNELLNSIRMLKFMGWERNFEQRVHAIRKKELKHQRLSYSIETLWNALWGGIPVFVTLASFWHYAIFRNQPLTPSVAFTSILVFAEMRFALTSLPELIISLLQGFVSVKRVEKYLNGAEVVAALPLDQQRRKSINLQSCTATWPTTTPTSSNKFHLIDVSLDFPEGELSLICGKIGSGKTLLLLALLGEADIISGQIRCPRTPPDFLYDSASRSFTNENWVVDGACAYASQVAWLRNASVKDNILFGLPYNEERYSKTLEACALVKDLEIFEDGDLSEIGERGVTLSGGQKARISLARAVYSRAATLLLDDILSAVDANTAHHLYHECLKGELVVGRTVILVSHHVQLCSAGASYIVALDNGNVRFEGFKDGFYQSGIFGSLLKSSLVDDQTAIETVATDATLGKDTPVSQSQQETASTPAGPAAALTKADKKTSPRKLIQDETRAQGHVRGYIWASYIRACGGIVYWTIFVIVFIVASVVPALDRGWLGYWSNAALNGEGSSPTFYISIYALITLSGLIVSTIRWLFLYSGSIRASNKLYAQLLEAVLFAKIKFYDITSCGSLLNRFGKDFEGIDSRLSAAFGHTLISILSVTTTFVTISIVSGPPFILGFFILGFFYWIVTRAYGKSARDLRRLESVTRSPIYSVYGETVAGVSVIRAYGASSQLLRDMLRVVDTNTTVYYWVWGVNRWLNIRFNLLSATMIGITGVICLTSPRINASLAGFVLALIGATTQDLLGIVRRFVALEQALVAIERTIEYSDIPEREPPEYIHPRPKASWPSEGAIICEDLCIRYDADLPNVLHNISFKINPGEKIGILGRTGSGKSTLALSFFRFIEANQGRILIDEVDISSVGITDLRTRLTIIPQDPTLLSGTIRSTLDVFNEYEDAAIYEALRRVHLIPTESQEGSAQPQGNQNIFKDLELKVSGRRQLLSGKQLLCMARATLKHSKVIIMDEATASVDYVTDELIGKTIREQFVDSTILTIAHRLRTIIDNDRVMILDQGSIVEFDRPAALLRDPGSKFYSLCKATGNEEFALLRSLLGV